MVDRKRLSELLAAADGERWQARLLSKFGTGESWGGYRSDNPLDTRQVFRTMSSTKGRELAALIVEAVNALPALLDELDVNDEALKAMEDVLAEFERAKNVIALYRASADAETVAAADVMLRGDAA